MISALDTLLAVHDQPHAPAQRQREAGKTVIACVGDDIPGELLTAAGLSTVWVTGDPLRPPGAAERYLGVSTDERSRSQLDRLLAGEFAYAARVLVCHDCEGSRRLYAAASELRRLGMAAELPPTELLDLLHLPYRTSQRYNLQRLAGLRALAERWSGQAVDDDHLRAAVAAANSRRRLIGRVAALRLDDPPRLTGVQALQVIGAGRYLDGDAHARLLGQLVAAADDLPRHHGIRVFVTGSDQDHPAPYALIESSGAVVVGEDQAWGTPAGESEVAVTEDPLEGIADHYQFRVGTAAKRSIAERASTTAARARACRAQAVIGFGRRGDSAPAWDYPAQRRALAAHGIAMTFVGDEPYAAAASPRAAEQVREFLESVRAGAAVGG